MEKFICSCHDREFATEKQFKKHLYDFKNKDEIARKQKIARDNPEYRAKAQKYDQDNFLRFRERKNKSNILWAKTKPNYFKDNYIKNKDKILLVAKKYRNSEIGQQKRLEYRNKPEVIERLRQYNIVFYQQNRDKILTQVIAYQKTPQGKAVQKAKDIRRRTILSGPQHSKLTKDKILDLVQHNVETHGCLTCELCYQPILNEQYAIDHAIPIIRFEEYPEIDLSATTNLLVAHDQFTQEACNNKKFDYTLAEWFELFPEYFERGLALGHIQLTK